MSKNKQSNPRNFLIIWAIFGIAVVLLSFHLTAGPYAKYSSQSTGSDGARVIKFGDLTITEMGDFTSVGTNVNQFVFVPGVPIEKNVLVTFGGSEAATIVFITVRVDGWETEDNLNFTDSVDQLSWGVDSDWTYLKTEGDTYVYYRSLEPNEALTDDQFIKDGTIQVSQNGTVEMYENYPDISFAIRGYVVQANKFDSAAEAWASLNSNS